MRENVTISYRGRAYEIGRGERFYGIWAVGSPGPEPMEWWPDTPDGWSAAWARFTSIEPSAAIAPVGHSPSAVPASGLIPRIVAAVALLGAGIALGVAGLFPGYLNGASLAQQAEELVPHLIYLAAWTASGVLLLLGGTRARVGAMLGVGVSLVTLGLYFADFGYAISGSAHGAGLWLELVSWLACASGTAVAFWQRRAGQPGKPRGDEAGPVVMLILAGLGAAVAFAPSWDSYTLRTAAGATQSLTAGNAFANPAWVIVGNVAVMLALAAVVAVAALWRPIRFGAALLAGAIIPMAAQAISALVQATGTTSPSLFGISPSQAAAAGLTISSGLTAVFWIFCAFVVAMIASCAWMLMTPHSALPTPPHPQGPHAWPPFGPQPDTTATTVPAPEIEGGEPASDADQQPAPAGEPAHTGPASPGEGGVGSVG